MHAAAGTWLWYTHHADVTILLSHAELRHTHIVPACDKLTGGTTAREETTSRRQDRRKLDRVPVWCQMRQGKNLTEKPIALPGFPFSPNERGQ